MANKRLIFNAFVMCTSSHIIHGLWRHPKSRQRDMNDLGAWVELAQLLEKGKFDAIFAADAIALGADHRGGTDLQIEQGVLFPANDPSVLMAALIGATKDLGLVFTSSALQAHPFEFARRASTMDHFSDGRIGWNIVMTTQRNAFRNFGFDELVEHAERYAWGQEYIDVTYKLWEGSWEDDALLFDAARNIVTDPAKVHAINHVGARYKVVGPSMTAPSPQRTPVLFQAGSSGPGRDFAAHNAEGVFLLASSPQAAQSLIADTRARAVAAGRHADDLVFVQGLTFVVGDTEAEALRRDAEYDELLSVDGQLALQSGVIGVDLGLMSLDTPLVEVARRAVGLKGMVESIVASAPAGTVPTLSDLARLTSRSLRVVGTPEQIVDKLQPWIDAGIDGFNVMYIETPGSYIDFIEQVVPVLQQRGLMQTDYAEGTLREKMFGSGPHLPQRHPARAYRRHFD